MTVQGGKMLICMKKDGILAVSQSEKVGQNISKKTLNSVGNGNQNNRYEPK